MAKSCIHWVEAKMNSENHHSESQRKTYDYVRSDLTHKNEKWESPLMFKKGERLSLEDYFEMKKQEYKDSVGQSPQLKDRERVNKKTGKTTIVRGWTPIREAVVIMNENHTLDDVMKVANDILRDKFNMRPLLVFTDMDEGHYGNNKAHSEEEDGKWYPNLHAHIVFDNTYPQGTIIDGKDASCRSVKLTETELTQLQTLVAETLAMTRGELKAITNADHIDSVEYKTKMIVENAEAELQEINRQKDLSEEVLNKNKEEANTINTECSDKEKYLINLNTEIGNSETTLNGIRDDIEEAKKEKDQIEIATNIKSTVNSGIEKIGSFFGKETAREKSLREDFESKEANYKSQLQNKDVTISNLKNDKITISNNFQKLLEEKNNTIEQFKSEVSSVNADKVKVENERDSLKTQLGKEIEKNKTASNRLVNVASKILETFPWAQKLFNMGVKLAHNFVDLWTEKKTSYTGSLHSEGNQKEQINVKSLTITLDDQNNLNTDNNTPLKDFIHIQYDKEQEEQKESQSLRRGKGMGI